MLIVASAKLSLSNTARSSTSSRSSSRAVAKCRYDAVPAARIPSIIAVSPGSWSGAGPLQIQQHRHPRGQPELILQTRDLHPRPNPAVPLPIDADENLTLLQVGPIHAARRMRPGAGLIPHRNQMQPPDRPQRRRPLLSQLLQRRGNKHPDPLIRRKDHRRPILSRFLARRNGHTRLPPFRRITMPHLSPPDLARQEGVSRQTRARPSRQAASLRRRRL